MKVINEILVAEINGEEVKTIPNKTFFITSHWLHNDKVVIEFEDKKFTVYASDLHKAINNAVNHK